MKIFAVCDRFSAQYIPTRLYLSEENAKADANTRGWDDERDEAKAIVRVFETMDAGPEPWRSPS